MLCVSFHLFSSPSLLSNRCSQFCSYKPVRAQSMYRVTVTAWIIHVWSLNERCAIYFGESVSTGSCWSPCSSLWRLRGRPMAWPRACGRSVTCAQTRLICARPTPSIKDAFGIGVASCELRSLFFFSASLKGRRSFYLRTTINYEALFLSGCVYNCEVAL